MVEEIIKRDQNRVTVLAGVTNDVDLDVTMLRVDPITKRLLISVNGGGSGTVTQINTAGLISGGPITTTGTITTSMNTNKLVGRGTAGTGVMEEITLGTNLSLSGTTLNATGGGGAVAGSDTQIQFNQSSAFGADSQFTWDYTNHRLGVGATSAKKLTVAGDIQITSAGTTITTAGTELLLEETGDALGTVRMHLQNRNGANGAIFENAALDVVDFGFITSTSNQFNFRYEHRSTLFAFTANTNGEFQSIRVAAGLGTTISAVGQAATYFASPIVSIGTLPAIGTITFGKIQDTTAGPGVAFRQANNTAFGFDFDLETVSVGRLDINRVNSSTRTTIMSLMRQTGRVGINNNNPAFLFDVNGKGNMANGLAPRTVVMADATSFTPTADTADQNTQANTQILGNLTANAPTGTPLNGQSLVIRIKSTNVQTYVWNAIYRAGSTVTLPVTSTGGTKTDYLTFVYNSADTKWDLTEYDAGF